MKKILFIFCTSTIIMGCKKVRGHEGIDTPPCAIEITVNDVEGNNLFDPAVEGNMTKNKVTATLKGVVYKLTDGNYYGASARTREMGPYWFDFFFRNNVVIFGLFNGGGGYYREEVVIDWGDGTTDTIWFDCDVVLSADGSEIAETHRRLWLKTAAAPDGELVDDDGLTVTIVRPASTAE